jgi:hypothetical protein
MQFLLQENTKTYREFKNKKYIFLYLYYPAYHAAVGDHVYPVTSLMYQMPYKIRPSRNKQT